MCNFSPDKSPKVTQPVLLALRAFKLTFIVLIPGYITLNFLFPPIFFFSDALEK